MSKKWKWALGVFLLMAIVGGIATFEGHLSLSCVHSFCLHYKKLLDQAIKSKPEILFLSMAFLPAVGCPMSVLCMLGGIAYGFKIALGLITLGVAVNLSMTYWLARLFLGKLVPEGIEKLGYQVPEFSPQRQVQFTLLLRIAPMPFALRNYLLGTLRVSFKTYFILSLPIEILWAAGYILSGGALAAGHLKWLLGGVVLLVLIMAAAHFLRRSFNTH